MNLSSLTSYITEKMGQTDDASVAFCKLSINSNYEQIWDSMPWRDSLCLVSSRQFSGVPNNINQTGVTSAATSFAIFPPEMERVLSVRLDPNTCLHASDLVTVMDYNSEIFNDSGVPIGFSVMAPIAFGPLVDGSTSSFKITPPFSDSGQDIGLAFFITYERSDGSVNTYNGTLPDLSGSPLELFDTEPVTAIHSFNCDALSQQYELEFGLSLAMDPPPWPGIQSIFLPPGQITVPRCPRIRVLTTPQIGSTLLSVCKRRFVPLAGDSDEPYLTNIDNALIAMTQADLLERNRQYAKAQAKNQEGAAQVKLMVDLERQQTASQTRIIPADIHGEFIVGGFGSQGKGYW